MCVLRSLRSASWAQRSASSPANRRRWGRPLLENRSVLTLRPVPGWTQLVHCFLALPAPHVSPFSSPPASGSSSSAPSALQAIVSSPPQVSAPSAPTSRPERPTGKSVRCDQRDRSYVRRHGPHDVVRHAREYATDKGGQGVLLGTMRTTAAPPGKARPPWEGQGRYFTTVRRSVITLSSVRIRTK